MIPQYYESTSMRKMIDRTREGLNEEQYHNPHILGNKDSELSTKVMDSDNYDKKISLDNNMEATVVSDGGELAENITTGLQTVLNGFVEAIRGSVTNTDLISVHVGNSAVVITVKTTLEGGMPVVFNINSSNQSVQIKYDNFLELTDKNMQLMQQVKQYFNPKLIAQLQGVVSTGV